MRIDGTLDYRQQKQHLPFTFTVPTGATRLTIQFDYGPKFSQGQTLRNDLSLTLFDPTGARGARHNNQDRNLTITAYSATPGYIPGVLQPGVWTVWIDTHRILPPDVINFWFEIDISTDPISETDQRPVKGTTAPRGAGWYRGDLHGHTLHSDGRWDVPDLVQYARDYKLDFVTLSDHNTVSGLAQMDSLAADDLLTMGGVELTTYYGHALALGVRQWMEWRVGIDGTTMPDLAARAMQAGATFIIAHPMALGDPFCTGCDWAYPDMMPGNAHCVEIWNTEWDSESQNDQAVALWYKWLNQGYRMAATRGTDIHAPMTDPNPAFNVVYAEELSEAAVLAAVRQGHLYISVAPRLELAAQGDSTGIMGDLVAGDSVEVRLTWSNCAAADHLRLIVNGEVREDSSVAEYGQHQWTFGTSEARWCVVEIRSADGAMRAITNAIRFGTAADWR